MESIATNTHLQEVGLSYNQGIGNICRNEISDPYGTNFSFDYSVICEKALQNNGSNNNFIIFYSKYYVLMTQLGGSLPHEMLPGTVIIKASC